MAPTLDSGTLLYVLGVGFALGALAFFASEVVFDLSITVTAALLFLTFLAFLVVGLTIERESLDRVAFAIAGLAYVVWLIYIASSYDLSEISVFVLLVTSAAFFVAFGYGLREDRLTVARRTAVVLLVGFAGVGFLLVGADSVGGMEYSADFENEITVAAAGDHPEEEIHVVRQQIGTLTTSNAALFTRALDQPSLSACLVGVADENGGDRSAPRPEQIRTSYEPSQFNQPDQLSRNEEFTAEIHVRFEVSSEVIEEGESIAIERVDDCSKTRDEPTILVAFEDRTVE